MPDKNRMKRGFGMTAFIIWSIVGLFFIVMGIYCMLSKKQKEFGFWANADTFPVKNIKKYNAAIGKMWIVFGILFIITGLPLLNMKNPISNVIIILGPMLLAMFTMIFYVLVIERKYRK